MWIDHQKHESVLVEELRRGDLAAERPVSRGGGGHDRGAAAYLRLVASVREEHHGRLDPARPPHTGRAVRRRGEHHGVVEREAEVRQGPIVARVAEPCTAHTRAHTNNYYVAAYMYAHR